MFDRKNKIFLFSLVFVSILTINLCSDVRDQWHQPEKVMNLVGVKPGMVIGEVGAGRGYFTFKLSNRVGEKGKIYANDISSSALRAIQRRCQSEEITNIETVLGEVEDPLLPKELDMVFIVNAFHDFSKPVELLNNLLPSLKQNAPVVILDRDPTKYNDRSGHFYTQEELLERITQSDFALDKIETFLPQHNIYIIRAEKRSSISQEF